MKTEFDSPACLPGEDSSALKVTIIYDDFACGARAKNFAERLAAQLGSACPLAESLWRSDLLEYPPIAAEAARATAGCDYLIVALHADRVFPLATRQWIEARLDGAAGHGTGLVMLLNSGGENRGAGLRAPGNARHHLRSRCAEKGVPFFCSAGTLSADDAVASLIRREESPGLGLGRWPRTPALGRTRQPQRTAP